MGPRETQPRVTNDRFRHANSDEIKAGIDETRHRMDETLDELVERFHPRHLLQDAIDYLRGPDRATGQRVKETVSHAGQTVWHQVQQHPMPSLLIGAGIAWMIMEQRESQYGVRSSSELSDRASETAERARQAAGETAHSVREKGREQAERLKETTAKIGTEVRHRASQAYEYGQHKVAEGADRHPLAFGAGALAIGLLAGLAFPSTRTEDRMMGRASDQVRDQARETAEKGIERTKQAATAAASVIGSQMKSPETQQPAAEKTTDIAERARQAAQDEVRRSEKTI